MDWKNRFLKAFASVVCLVRHVFRIPRDSYTQTDTIFRQSERRSSWKKTTRVQRSIDDQEREAKQSREQKKQKELHDRARKKRELEELEERHRRKQEEQLREEARQRAIREQNEKIACERERQDALRRRAQPQPIALIAAALLPPTDNSSVQSFTVYSRLSVTIAKHRYLVALESCWNSVLAGPSFRSAVFRSRAIGKLTSDRPSCQIVWHDEPLETIGGTHGTWLCAGRAASLTITHSEVESNESSNSILTTVIVSEDSLTVQTWKPDPGKTWPERVIPLSFERVAVQRGDAGTTLRSKFIGTPSLLIVVSPGNEVLLPSLESLVQNSRSAGLALTIWSAEQLLREFARVWALGWWDGMVPWPPEDIASAMILSKQFVCGAPVEDAPKVVRSDLTMQLLGRPDAQLTVDLFSYPDASVLQRHVAHAPKRQAHPGPPTTDYVARLETCPATTDSRLSLFSHGDDVAKTISWPFSTMSHHASLLCADKSPVSVLVLAGFRPEPSSSFMPRVTRLLKGIGNQLRGVAVGRSQADGAFVGEVFHADSLKNLLQHQAEREITVELYRSGSDQLHIGQATSAGNAALLAETLIQCTAAKQVEGGTNLLLLVDGSFVLGGDCQWSRPGETWIWKHSIQWKIRKPLGIFACLLQDGSTHPDLRDVLEMLVSAGEQCRWAEHLCRIWNPVDHTRDASHFDELCHVDTKSILGAIASSTREQNNRLAAALRASLGQESLEHQPEPAKFTITRFEQAEVVEQ